MRLALSLVGLIVPFLGACGVGGGSTATNTANLTSPAPPIGAQACASPQSLNGVKRRLFANARVLPGANAAAIDSLERGTVTRIIEPVVDQLDTEIGRTICSGRLILDLPPGVERAFGGERQLSVQIRYSSQQAADGSGNVYDVFGAEALALRLSQAAGGRAPPIAPQGVGPAEGSGDQSSFNPSFRCSPRNTQVERMTCSSPELSSLDRRSTSAYNRALELADEPGARSEIRQFQRGFLRDLSACRTRYCIARAYQAHISRLQMIAGE